ncbi:ClpX C4-type zinc finger protein [Yersinia kristensenii]|uniref:ClpX C4-type zinc finger protein n=1 Tax=Yersinia kristensenii TaxID=28152 RepID=UPI0008FEB0FA|nr:hypothetical protein CRM81_08900 [Yersinia kristensenii]SUP67202.1 ATP-dependent protease ATP-binding subunit ClpX [Yersinia kristensenii]
MDIGGVNEKGNAKVFCSFCEKPSEELTYLVASKFAAICSDCIALSVKIIADKANQNTAEKSEIVNFDREISQKTITVRFEKGQPIDQVTLDGFEKLASYVKDWVDRRIEAERTPKQSQPDRVCQHCFSLSIRKQV